jgi:hypothetical protein
MASKPTAPSPHTLAAIVAAGSIVMIAAMLVRGPLAERAFAVATVLFPVVLIALGTRRAWPRLRVVLGALGVIVALSAIGILLLGADTPAAEHVLGLPPAAWLALAGLGLVPFILVVWSHAATFAPPEVDRADASPDADRAHG